MMFTLTNTTLFENESKKSHFATENETFFMLIFSHHQVSYQVFHKMVRWCLCNHFAILNIILYVFEILQNSDFFF